MRRHVILETPECRERHVANVAGVLVQDAVDGQSLVRIDVLAILLPRASVQRQSAYDALSLVHLQRVRVEVRPLTEGLAANLAQEGPLPVVYEHVTLHARPMHKLHAARITHVPLLLVD